MSITISTATSSFRMDSVTGAVSIASVIDIETDPASYTMIIQATDGVNPPVSDTLIITVSDVNDNGHRFTSSGNP